MKSSEVIAVIIELSADSSLSFVGKANQFESRLNTCSKQQVLEHLECVGVIPESFEHDSTEEKLYAKYCDAVLGRALRELSLDARMLSERSGAADVRATASDYELVGDAKAFRLSRTAKNQKDFKVEALNQWREGADYACLVAPIYQYPKSTSQIYSQAIRYNVTLLSYTHLAFIVRSRQVNPSNLRRLWQIGEELKSNKGISQNASLYWSAILAIVLEITQKRAPNWAEAVESTRASLQRQAKEQVRYWEEQKRKIESLDQKIAVKQLVQALKIDTKIQVVRKTAEW
jgi:hypothetical protein